MPRMNEQLQNSQAGGAPATPRQKRLIHFVSGETLEEDSSEEEECEGREELFAEPTNAAPLSWRTYSRILWMQFRTKSLRTCDFVGGKLASLAGLNAAKYQYAADEYQRHMEERLRLRSTSEGISMATQEKKHRSSQADPYYGATDSTGAPDHLGPAVGAEHTRDGSQNWGYQAEEQQTQVFTS